MEVFRDRLRAIFCIPAAGIALVLAATTLHAVGLPDTGQSICYNDTGNPDIVPASSPVSISRDGGTHPRQDCRYGRDPAVVAAAVQSQADPECRYQRSGNHWGLSQGTLGQ